MQYAKILFLDNGKTPIQTINSDGNKMLYVMDNDIGKYLIAIKGLNDVFDFLTPNGTFQHNGKSNVDLFDSSFQIASTEIEAQHLISQAKTTNKELNKAIFCLFEITRNNTSEGVVKCIIKKDIN